MELLELVQLNQVLRCQSSNMETEEGKTENKKIEKKAKPKQEEKEKLKMEEENNKEKNEKILEVKQEQKEIKKEEEKVEEKKQEEMVKEKKPEKKEKKQEKQKKTEARVNATDLHISKKHSMALCRFVVGKTPEKAVKELEEVLLFKRAIPFKGEIPHRKGMMSGRYPINATKIFIKLLKSLNANASVCGLEEPVVSVAKADRASRPYKRGGQRFKRCHVLLIAKEAGGKK